MRDRLIKLFAFAAVAMGMPAEALLQGAHDNGPAGWGAATPSRYRASKPRSTGPC